MANADAKWLKTHILYYIYKLKTLNVWKKNVIYLNIF